MRYICTIIIALISVIGFCQEEDAIILKGVYQGKSIYVQNPFNEGGYGFCIQNVTVNDQEVCPYNGSGYEIGFWCYDDLKLGDSLVIKIEHPKGCRPKVLNPEVLRPKSTFEIVEIDISKTGILSWSTKNEQGGIPFIVEQYRWNKWIKFGEINGKGKRELNEYEVDVSSRFHSGMNRFRVKQVGHSGKPRFSHDVKVDPGLPEISFTPVKVKRDITFNDSTLYEIYDAFGNIVKKGYNIKINNENLRKGVYYINYDNKTEKFIKT